ncbi:MAG: DUF3617 domain-containing protein [Novosphingobium sp.]|uniref:DUF3617 domain-containing protein n=1 Tax=Novosphingobium sp. TaxID=1874826 RepID=UPI0032BB6E41
MRPAITISIIAALALSACGQSSDSNSGAGKDGAGDRPGITIPDGNLADADFRVKAGQYRTTVSIQKVVAEGLPPQITAAMPKQQSFEYCITPEQSAAGLEGVKQQMAKGNCQYESFQASGGKVDAVFTCNSGRGMDMRATSHGTYSDSGSDVAVVGDMVMAGGKSVHVEQSVRAERIGDCAK